MGPTETWWNASKTSEFTRSHHQLFISIRQIFENIWTSANKVFWDKRWRFFYSDNPAIRRKHIQEFWLYRLKHVHCFMTNNIRALWYHPSGTFYGQVENMDFVPYVRISRLYYYVWILESNFNVTDLIICNQQSVLRKINDSFVKASILKIHIIPKNTA